MATAHINIGSNIGNRRALIESAVARIEAALGSRAARAVIVESEPWGYDSPNPYLNLGIAVDVACMSPLELHRTLQDIQRGIDPGAHRDERGVYADRAIDIDLIALGQTIIDTPGLTLPHPRMHLRRFVLQPMAELEPDWTHPILHLTVVQMIAAYC